MSDEVLFVHGITFSGRSWDPVAEHLGADVRCLQPDLPGHGGGPAPAPQACRIAVLAERLGDLGLSCPLVVGHSFGALVAVAFAARHPVRGLVVVDQRLEWSQFAALGGARAASLDPAALAAWLEDLIGLDDLAEPARSRAEGTRHATPETISAVFQQLVGGGDAVAAGTADDVTRLGVPLLAVHRAAPDEHYVRWLHERVPGAEVEVWPGGGHMPHLAQPERFARRCLEMLR